ncbi:hypothetical protein Tco_1015320 [Tanacetum coccineum]|uniref:Uncharacterized protein n=1 Tax=Tanacetum coccineum TaxID=301880 RepID=A0ABQ5FLM7_9ASTR
MSVSSSKDILHLQVTMPLLIAMQSDHTLRFLVFSVSRPTPDTLLRKTGDMASFIQWYCKQIEKKKLVKADSEDQIDWANPEGNQRVHDMSKPLPLGGPPERRHALSISKLKVAYYPDFGLEELVPSLWTESESKYDISSAYDILHWWFKRKEFYITRHSARSDRNAVRSHMRILSVISLKTYSRYGYTYLREIVLHRADYKEYKISEADFKNLHPNDFEDLYLLNLQGKLNHLSGANKVHLSTAVNLWTRNIVIRQRVEDLQLCIESYQTKLNLTQPIWDATNFLFKEDYTIVHKPRAVIYRDRNNQKKMMRETEVHKFSDGTLTKIVEKLDYMVKEYKLFKFNLGMENRIWTEDDKRRSQEFIKLIERRLKIRRIFRSLESFVSESQNRRDIPRDNPLVSVEVLRYDIKRSKSENKRIVPTEMELVLEQTQQGSSHEVSIVIMDLVTQCTTLPSHSRSLKRLLFHFSWRLTHFYRLSHSELVDIEKVAVSSSLRSLKPKHTVGSRAKRSSINLVRTLIHYICLSHTVKTRNILRVLRIILVILPEHPSDTKVLTVKMEILLEPTSNKLYGR